MKSIVRMFSRARIAIRPRMFTIAGMANIAGKANTAGMTITTRILLISAVLLTAAAAAGLSAQDGQDQETNVRSAKASSALEDKLNPNRYSVKKLFDGDPRTCWVEGVGGDGIGQWAQISIDPPVKIDTVEIMPGYFDERYWAPNSRVASIRIYLGGEGGEEIQEHTLIDQMKPQRIQVGGRRLSGIKLEILSVYPGSKWQDTCIAELGLYWGSVRIPYWTNPEVDKTGPVGGSLGYASQTSMFSWNFYRDGTFEHIVDDPLGRPVIRLHERGIWRMDWENLVLTRLMRTGRRGEGAYTPPKGDEGPGPLPGKYERYVDFTEWVEEKIVENWGDVVNGRGRTVAGEYHGGPYGRP